MRATITIVTIAAVCPPMINAQAKPVDEQVAEAVTALPEQMRAGASVLGYAGGDGGRKLTMIHKGESACKVVTIPLGAPLTRAVVSVD